MVKAEGFSTNVTRNSLVLGSTTLLTVALKVGSAIDVIEVTADSSVDKGKTESSTNINLQLIESLPINQRNFLDFSLTAARGTPDRLPAQGIAITSDISFTGQPARYNNITIDGVDNNDNSTGAVACI